jgi:hypothetical protein
VLEEKGSHRKYQLDWIPISKPRAKKLSGCTFNGNCSSIQEQINKNKHIIYHLKAMIQGFSEQLKSYNFIKIS